MPVFDWSCSCGHEEEAYVHSHREVHSCSKCGAEMVREWSLGARHQGSSAFPFTTTHLNGKPIEVTSESHLRELCKEHGVTHRPDNAFLEKTFKGVNPRTGKPEYHEGSGRGMPGSWV